MKSLKQFSSVLMLLFSVLYFGSAYAADVTLNLEAGDYVVQGEQIIIPVQLTAVDAERSVGGAAFSINFDDSVLNFISAKSPFFGTFASHGITPKKIQLDPPDGPTYDSPLVTNNLSNGLDGLVMLAAARPTPGIIPAGDSVVLFELIFAAEDTGAPAANYEITLSQSKIYNPDAGYTDPLGTPIVALIDANDTFDEVTVDFNESAPLMLSIHNADDRDNDGLLNTEEKVARTNPNNPDTDGDGLSDGDEVHTYLTNPKSADSDKDGFSDAQEIFLAAHGDENADPNNKNGSPGINFEVAVIDNLTEAEQTISFTNIYFDPVVVAGPASITPVSVMNPTPDIDATFIQIYDVTPGDGITPGSFKIKLTDACGAATPGILEKVHWIAMERGSFALENGKRIFAGKLESKNQKKANKFEKVKLPKKFFKQTPVVLASTNTINDPDEPAAVRLDKVKKTGFSFTLQEDSANQKQKISGHGSEEVSYIAFDTFTDIFGEFPNEIILEIGSRGKAFDDTLGSIKFAKAHFVNPPEFPAPFFLADMQTAYDKDSAQLRFNNNVMGPESYVELFVQEDDAIGDLDTEHKKPETVGYFATSPIDMTDRDGDGLENDYELYTHKTDPDKWDTDGDGLGDGYELDKLANIDGSNTDPLKWDSDGDGAGDGHEDGAVDGDPNDPGITPQPVFEVQVITIGDSIEDDGWKTITFNTSFYDPIIVAPSSSAEMVQGDWPAEQPAEPTLLVDPGEVGMNPEIVQIRKLTNLVDGTLQSWQIRSQPLAIKILGDNPATPEVETEYLEVPDPIERRVIVTIVERGAFTTPEGNVVIADSDTYQQTKKNKFKKIKFPKTPKIPKTAVVFASVTSAKDVDNPIYHRLHNVSKKGFSYMFQEEEYNDGKHVIEEDGQPTEEGEMLSYIVFGGARSGVIFGEQEQLQVNTTVNGINSTEPCYYAAMLHKKNLGDVQDYFDPGPMFISLEDGVKGGMMDMQSAYDKEPANLRYREAWLYSHNPLTDPPDAYFPFISEDKSKDAETSHKMENMGTLLFTDFPLN